MSIVIEVLELHFFTSCLPLTQQFAAQRTVFILSGAKEFYSVTPIQLPKIMAFFFCVFFFYIKIRRIGSITNEPSLIERYQITSKSNRVK